MCVVRVKENDLLPVLLDEFPPLQFSPHTLSHMWKQQFRQVDRLSALDDQHKHTRKHTNQVRTRMNTHTQTHLQGSALFFLIISAFSGNSLGP